MKQRNGSAYPSKLRWRDRIQRRYENLSNVSCVGNIDYTTMTDQAKTSLGCFIFILIILLAVGMIPTFKVSPENARFYVDEDANIVVPAPRPGSPLFFSVPGHGLSTTGFDRIATNRELENHPYEIPATPEWDSYELYGPKVSILRAMIFGHPKRWTEEGWWNF